MFLFLGECSIRPAVTEACEIGCGEFIQVNQRFCLRPVEQLAAAEMPQLLLCRLLQSARVGVVQKCLDGNFDRGSLGIGSGLNRFGQIDWWRFLGILQLIDEFLRLFPTARLRRAPDEFSRLGSSLNPFWTFTAPIRWVLLLARGDSDGCRRTT